MKKIITALLAGIILLSFNSCVNNSTESSEGIEDALKISTWVMDKNLEGTGYWEYDANATTIIDGYWVSNESDKQIHHTDVFKFERLELNEVRVMAPMNYKTMSNINLNFEFDGIIEIETEIPNDRRIQLSYNNDRSDKTIENIIDFGTVTFGKVTIVGPTVINLCPLGEDIVQGGVISYDTIVGQEYYLNVKTYTLDGTLVISAKLKLVAIEDEGFPREQYSKLSNEDRTRFFSIELVSYDYSDAYKAN